MPELALGESPVGARGLCWPPQPWVGTEMGTPEPGLGKGVDCGAPVCQSPCTQGLPAPRASLHPGSPFQLFSPRLCMPVGLQQTCHSLCLFFILKRDKSLVRDARKEH